MSYLALEAVATGILVHSPSVALHSTPRSLSGRAGTLPHWKVLFFRPTTFLQPMGRLNLVVSVDALESIARGSGEHTLHSQEQVSPGHQLLAVKQRAAPCLTLDRAPIRPASPQAIRKVICAKRYNMFVIGGPYRCHHSDRWQSPVRVERLQPNRHHIADHLQSQTPAKRIRIREVRRITFARISSQRTSPPFPLSCR